MLVEWDKNKNRSNFAKHGLSFEEVEAFEWDSALMRVDDREDYGEVRYQALGFIESRLCFFAFTETETGIRAISLRRAHRKEILKWQRSQ